MHLSNTFCYRRERMKNLRVKTNRSNVLLLHLATVLCLLILGGLQTSQAQTFAQFQQRNAQQQGFSYTNNTTTSSLTTNTAGTGLPIFFQFSVAGLPTELQGIQNATLFLNAVSNTPAEAAGSGGGIRQNFQSVELLILRDAGQPAPPASSCINACNVLLRATVSSGFPAFTSSVGDSSGNFQASSPSENVTFFSDFLIFNTTTARAFALSFSSIIPPVAFGTNFFLQNFTAAGAGTFSATPTPCAIAVCGPTPAVVFVSGRVLTPNGRGLSNALVNLTESDGTVHTVRTTAFGYYRFVDLTAGQNVTISVSSKRYSFAPRIINLNEEIENLNLVSQP